MIRSPSPSPTVQPVCHEIQLILGRSYRTLKLTKETLTTEQSLETLFNPRYIVINILKIENSHGNSFAPSESHLKNFHSIDLQHLEFLFIFFYFCQF